MTTPEPPSVPAEILEHDGWEFQEERTETFFEMPAVRIRGTTRQYGDRRSREALQSTTGNGEEQIRFFAVTRLGFEPGLPGVRPTMVVPILNTAMRRVFPERLEQRGLSDIERGRSERLRLADENSVQLEKYTAADDIGDTPFELVCWVGSWIQDTDIFVVSGGYPRTSIAHQLGIETDDAPLTRSQAQYREEFFSLLRGVADCN